MVLALCSVFLVAAITACGAAEAPPLASAPSVIPSPSITQDDNEPTDEVTGELQLELTTAQGETILFALNDSNAAKSLYEQLPLSLDIEDYGDHEKIFYPPEKLDTSNTSLAKGPVGTLAYYGPWGNVAIYSGDCGGASGLYQLGQVISGAEYISQLSGVVQLEAVSDDASSLVFAPPEKTDTPEAPSTPLQSPPSQSVPLTPQASTPPVQTPPPTNTPAPPVQEESPPSMAPPESTPQPSVPEENSMRSIQITAGNTSFSATLEENEAGAAFAKLLQDAPIHITMSDYSGFEKVGFLGTSLPASNSQMTAQAGDIILYNSNQICVFYGSNSWSYTRLGKIDDLSGWAQALGNGDVTLTFSLN